MVLDPFYNAEITECVCVGCRMELMPFFVLIFAINIWLKKKEKIGMNINLIFMIIYVFFIIIVIVVIYDVSHL